MRTLLIINDNSSAARHAAEFALGLAQKMQSDILLLNTSAIKTTRVRKVVAGDFDNDFEDYQASEIFGYLKSLNSDCDHFKPGIEEFGMNEISEAAVSDFINKNNVWMVVKGMPDGPAPSKSKLNIHAVLNMVLCPLLLIPERWHIKNIERIVYLTDLRYCALQIVRYLAGIAKQCRGALSIAHISASGLPDMAEKYALDVFSGAISNKVSYDQLFFNNIKEKNLGKAVDVMINGLHNDILALANHRFHFEEIVGRYITETLPVNISIPLCVFPC
jgi:hypothetical protein